MKILHIEPTDMGSSQDEIAEQVMDMVAGRDFPSCDEFEAIEGQLVTQACQRLGWATVPQTGGLIASWEETTNEQ